MGSARVRRRLHAEGGDDGFSLVEIMVSFVVFALMAVAVAAGLTAALHLSKNSHNRVIAAQLLQQRIDLLRNPALLPLATGTCANNATYCPDPAPINGVQYHITQSVQWASLGTASSPCDSAGGSSQFAYQRVSLTATWDTNGGVSSVRTNTILTPKNGSTNPATGAQPVRIYTSANANEPGVSVTLAPSTTSTPAGTTAAQTIQTDEAGCALFAFVQPGYYSVSTSTPGYVDVSGAQTHTQTIAIAVGQENSLVNWQYDKAASITVDEGLEAQTPAVAACTTFNTPTTGNCFNLPQGIGGTAYNVNRSAAGTAKVAESTSTSTSPGATSDVSIGGSSTCDTGTCLFPFATGYQVWGSTCSQGDPNYWTATRTVTVAPAPGASASAVVNEQPIYLKVLKASTKTNVAYATTGTNYSGVKVYAVHPSVSDCLTPGVADPLSATTMDGEAYFLGSTDATGVLQSSLPYGDWVFEYVSAGGTYSYLGTTTPATNPLYTPVKPGAALTKLAVQMP